MINIKQGDCLELMKEIPDKSVDLILADLPYGITRGKWDIKISFDSLWRQYKRIMNNNGVILLFGNEPFSSKLRMSNTPMYKYDWIWKKTRPTQFLNANRRPLASYENIMVFQKHLTTYNPQKTKGEPYTLKNSSDGTLYDNVHFQTVTTKNKGDRYPINVITFGNGSKYYHPTQKPVPLLEYLIKTYTNENDTVLDNTMGSGSTGVAAINLNRNFIGYELDQKYFEIAKERLNNVLDNNKTTE